jgi:hypothetical protein
MARDRRRTRVAGISANRANARRPYASHADATHLNSTAAARLISKSQVFRYPLADPYDLKNLHGFNHAPSIALLPDGRLLTTWFSGPFEASVHQLILSSISADHGVTWSPAEVIQDTPRTSDFDPAHIVDGQRTWFFFTAGRWNRYPSAGPRQKEAGRDQLLQALRAAQ